MLPPMRSARPSGNVLVFVLVGFTGVVWGAGGLISKALVDSGVDAFVVTGGPFLIGACIAWVNSLRHERVALLAIRDGALLGAINSAAPALLFNLAYQSLPAGTVAILLSIGPVITAITAHFAFSDERFNIRKGLGLAASAGGVVTLTFTPGLIRGAGGLGVLYALLGASVAGTTAILSRRLAVKHGARSVVASQLTAAGLVPIALASLLGRSLAPIGGWVGPQLVGIAVIGCIASYGGFRAIMFANQLGTTGQVSVVGYIVPLVGVAGGLLFLRESLTPNTVLGGSLILLGVALVGRASGKPSRLVRAAG